MLLDRIRTFCFSLHSSAVMDCAFGSIAYGSTSNIFNCICEIQSDVFDVVVPLLYCSNVFSVLVSLS